MLLTPEFLSGIVLIAQQIKPVKSRYEETQYSERNVLHPDVISKPDRFLRASFRYEMNPRFSGVIVFCIF